MRRYNFARPLLLLAVAFLTYNVISLICMTMGIEEELAKTYAFLGMLIAAIITFQRMNRHKRKK